MDKKLLAAIEENKLCIVKLTSKKLGYDVAKDASLIKTAMLSFFETEEELKRTRAITKVRYSGSNIFIKLWRGFVRRLESKLEK